MRPFFRWLRRLPIRTIRHAPAKAKGNHKNFFPVLEALETRIVPDSGGAAAIYAGARLGYEGGPLIANIQVEPIFIQDSVSGNQTSAANRAQFDAFFNAITTDGYIANQLYQYSAGGYTIGNGTVGADDISAVVAPNGNVGADRAYQDGLIQTTIANEIAAGNTAAPNANTVYVIFTPPGDAVINNGDNSERNFEGYHSTFTIGGQAIYYVVIPDQISTPHNVNAASHGFSPFQGMTQTASHEMAETITDPDCATGWSEVGPGFVGLDGGEIGDHGGNSANIMDGFSMQALWSNALTDLAHPPSSGANDLYINQIAAPAVDTWTGGPIATFTDLNTSLTASDFYADVSDDNGDWSNVTITGSDGHFVVSADPPAPLGDGEVGHPFGADGLQVIISTSPISFTNPSGAPTALKATAYIVNGSAPLNYIADSGSGPNDFVLKEAGNNFQLSDNGLVVFTQPIAATTGINITAAPVVPGDASQDVDNSLTVDYSGGMFANSITFDGGPGSGAHSITFVGGTFGSESYMPTSATGGSIVLGSQTVSFTNVETTINLTTAASFVISGAGANDQLTLTNGPVSGGVAALQLISANGTMGTVDFANQTIVTVQESSGVDSFTLKSSRNAAGLTTLNLDGGGSAGVLYKIQQTPSGLTTNVLGGGSAVMVDVGNAGSVQRILGPVNIDNSSGADNTILVDDSADAVGQTATLTATTLDGLAPADITYTAAGTQSLTIDGGTGGNRFIVSSAGLFPIVLNAGSGADVVTVSPLALGTDLTVNGQLPATPGDTLFYMAAGIDTPTGPGAGTITESGQGTVAYTGIENVRFEPNETVNAIWVNTDEITDPGARQNFVNQCVINGINTVYISVYQPSQNGNGLYMYDEANMAALISLAHAHGIQVWADYGAPDWPSLGAAPGSFPMERLADVVAYDAANPTAEFDGVMLDVEYVYNPANLASNDDQEHGFLQQLVPLYQAALNQLLPAGLEVGAAISAFWNPNDLSNPADQAAVTITVGSVTAPAYQQIINLGLDQVVVLGYRDFAGNIPASEGEDGIVGLDQDEVNYAASIASPSLIIAGLETQNILPSDQTFYSDGHLAMNGVMQTVAGYFGSNLGGFAIDGYGSVYLSGQPNWPASSQITPTINWANPADIGYGTRLSGTQLDAAASTAGTFRYTLADGVTPAGGAVLSAGARQTLEVTFTPSNTVDFTSVTDSVVINVLKATPSITWPNPPGISYGTALDATQLDATSNVLGTFNYTLADGVTPAAGAVLSAGMSQTLNVAFTPADPADYNLATDSVVINVAKATPNISWNNPADITYGTPLNSTQLNAGASVVGAFTYTLADGVTQAYGAVLNAGNGQTLNVSFTPADAVDYNSTSASVLVNVLKVTPMLNWSNPADIGYGVRLGATQLDATAGVPGVFTYTLADGMTPANGALLNAGYNQTLNVSFAPADALDFTSTTDSVVINVSTATPTFSGLSAPTIVYGTANTVISGHLNANANGQPVPAGEDVQITINGVTQAAALDSSDNYTTTFNTATLGAGPYFIDYYYAGDANFAGADSNTSVLTVNAATQTINFNPPPQSVYGSAPITLSATGGASPNNSVTFTLISGPATLVGNTLTVTGIGNVVVEADQAGDANYLAASPVQRTIVAAPTFQAAATEYENATPTAMRISTLLGTHFHDPDGTVYTKPGIAVFQTSGVGTWQYSVNALTWISIGPVTPTQALLLPAADWVRFLPTTNTSGQASIAFVAWDGSAGKAGTLANTQPGGGITAFSTNAGALDVTINPIVAWVGAGAALTPIPPATYSATSATTPAGNSIASVFGSYFQDVNPGVSVAVAVSGITGNGTWQYSTNGGTSWFIFAPAPSLASAYLLTKTDLIRFVPATSAATVGTLTAYAWDGSGSPPAVVNLTKTGVGKATGFSATALTAMAAANRAPTLSTPTITETPVPTSAVGASITVSSLLTQAGYSDPDGPSLPKGIAITGTSSSAGTFQYLLAGGVWQPLPNVSLSSALLLPSTASLRLVAGASTGTAQLTFVGWDQTAGVAGLTQNASIGGGANPFSTQSSTLSSAIKQAAPAWSAPSGALLTPILPGSYNPVNTTLAGNIVASVFGSYYLEGDPSRPIGIAVSAVTGAGTWQYSKNAGMTWSNFPVVSKTSALLLSANDKIRFVPGTTAPGTATLTAYAWDGSVGADGGPGNIVLLGAGGTSAFSATTLTAKCAVNNAPILTAPTVSLGAVNQNVPSAAFTATALLKDAGYSDADRGALSGIAITSAIGPGVWQWLNGSIWTALPSVPAGSAFLLPSTAQVRFQPTVRLPANTNSLASLTYLAWDQTAGAADSVYAFSAQGGASAFSQQATAAAMMVDFVSQSPSWAAGASAAFTPILGFSASNPTPNPSGDSVSTVFGPAFVAPPTVAAGIAITGLSSMSAGVWQYSTNSGTSWTNVPAVSLTSALLLPSYAKLRFVPTKLFSGVVTLTAYAWDGTGNFGTSANLVKSGIGGATPFSATALTATCLVNTAPTFTP